MHPIDMQLRARWRSPRLGNTAGVLHDPSLQQIIVTATGREERVCEVPQSVAVATGRATCVTEHGG